MQYVERPVYRQEASEVLNRSKRIRVSDLMGYSFRFWLLLAALWGAVPDASAQTAPRGAIECDARRLVASSRFECLDLMLRAGLNKEALVEAEKLYEIYGAEADQNVKIAWYLSAGAVKEAGKESERALWQGALQYMRRAVGKSPDNPHYLIHYALLVSKAEQPKDALPIYEKAFSLVDRSLVSRDESVVVAVGNYAEISAETGRLREAERELRLWIKPSLYPERLVAVLVYVVGKRSFGEAYKVFSDYEKRKGFSKYVTINMCDVFLKYRKREAITCFDGVATNKENGIDFIAYAKQKSVEARKILASK